MDQPLYPPSNADIARKRKEFAPQQLAAFNEFSKAVFADGPLPSKPSS